MHDILHYLSGVLYDTASGAYTRDCFEHKEFRQMRFLLPLVVALATTAACYAADSDNRSSPTDKNPRCMDRDVNSAAGKCVEPSAGVPRHKRPPAAGLGGAPSASTSSPAASNSKLKASGGAK